MCGRIVQSKNLKNLQPILNFQENPEITFSPRYNIAPTANIVAVRQGEQGREVSQFHWGIIPMWAKDRNFSTQTFNARSETLSEKPSFREAFKSRRCLIPVDGFYEWQQSPSSKNKVPFYFQKPTDEPIVFAGLWEFWRDAKNPEAPAIESCAIVTTEANSFMKTYHHRMPVMLSSEEWQAWLEPTQTDTLSLAEMLKPKEDIAITAHPVSSAVGNTRNDSPDMTKEIASQPSLF